MMRALWTSVVNGKTSSVVWWAAVTVYESALESWKLAAIYAVLLLLNAYSWDYQRRHGGVR